MICDKCKKELKKNIIIRNRFNDKIIFESNNSNNIKEAVEEAIKRGISLSEANLFGADLFGANLSKADLSKADLSKADLSEADLSEAYLSEADLFGADLFGANLYKANLFKANLFKADLLFCKMDKKVFKQITEDWFEWEVKK